MTISEAEQFLAATNIDASQPSVWADLGCGSGLFTQVLSARLHNGSCIYAIDKALPSAIPSLHKGVEIRLQKADFIADDLFLSSLHGILMANSLHYVSDKKSLIRKLKKITSAGRCFYCYRIRKSKS